MFSINIVFFQQIQFKTQLKLIVLIVSGGTEADRDADDENDAVEDNGSNKDEKKMKYF